MKLIIPVFIILLGMLAGAVVYKLFKETAKGFRLSVLAGGLGAFVGLLARDFLDITFGDVFFGALLAAIIGAVVFAALTNIVLGQIEK
ncbi:MAG: hypothetical protein AB8B87_00350 [Granulosicoccus sp.]